MRTSDSESERAWRAEDRAEQEAAGGMAAVVDVDVEVMTPEELEVFQEQERRNRIESFAFVVSEKRRRAIEARIASGVERRWLEDLDNYNGLDAAARREMFDDILRGDTGTGKASAPQRQTRRASVFVQVPRQRTNTAAARLGEKLFPSDEHNWDIEPTPVGEMLESLKGNGAKKAVWPEGNGDLTGKPVINPDTGQQMTVAEAIADARGEFERRTSRMKKVIQDQLSECNYNREGRRAIFDAALLGMGVIKGPVIANKVERRYEKRMLGDGQEIYEYRPRMVNKPQSKRVDPWNFYPAPNCGEDIHNGSYCFEREDITPQGLRDLAKIDGYDAAAIAQILREGPQQSVATGASMTARRTIDGYLGTSTYRPDSFELWTYTGDASIDDYNLFHQGKTAGQDDDDEAVLSSLSIVVVMCNDKVLKVEANPIDTGELPYDVFTWERVPGSPYGIGVVYLWRYAAKTVNAAWRAMLDNAGMTHGPQVVIDRSRIDPADGSWDIRGRKLWFAKSGMEGVDRAFAVFNIPTQQEALERIIQMAMRFGDEESGIPALMQGEQGSTPDKVGIVQMLLNASNVVLSAQAKNWDEQVTARHLRRYYDWNMQYHPDEGIKGDMEVKPIGSTHLIVRDQQKQDIANLMAFSQTPFFAKYVDPERLFRKAAAASSMGDVMRTDEEVEQWEQQQQEMQGQQPQDPRVQAAEIRRQESLEVAKLKVEGAIAAERVEAESERTNQELRSEEARRNDQRELQKMLLQRDLLMLKFAQENQMKLQDVQAQLSLRLIDANQKREQQRLDAALRDMGQFRTPDINPVSGNENRQADDSGAPR